MADANAVTRRLAAVEARLNQQPSQTGETQAELHAAWRDALAGARRELDAQRQQIGRLARDLDSETRRCRELEAALGRAEADATVAGATAAGAAQGARQAATTARQLREAAAAREVALEKVALLEREVEQLRAEAGGGGGNSPEETRLRADINDRRQEHTRALESKLAELRSERDRLARDANRLQIELTHAKEKVARLSQQDGRDSAVRDHAVRERDHLVDELKDERQRGLELREENARLHAEAAAAARRTAAAEAAVSAAEASAGRAKAAAVAAQAARVSEPIASLQAEDPRLRTAMREALSQRDAALALVKQLEEEVRRARAVAELDQDRDLDLWRERAELAEQNIQRYRLLATDLRAKVLESRRMAFDESARATRGSQAATAAVQKLAAENAQLRKRLAAPGPVAAPPPAPQQQVLVMADHDAGMSLAVLMGKQREIDILRNATERLQTFAELTQRFCSKAAKQARGAQRAQVDAQVLLHNAQLALEESSIAAVDGLPEGWERRRTALGLTFYVCHRNRYSTWLHPMFEGPNDVMDLDPYAPFPPGQASTWAPGDSGHDSATTRPTSALPLPPSLGMPKARALPSPPRVQRNQWSAYIDSEAGSSPAHADSSNLDANSSRTWDKLAQNMEKRKNKKPRGQKRTTGAA
jgi:hypothetical protein